MPEMPVEVRCSLRAALCAAALVCLPLSARAQSPVIEINGADSALEQNIRAHLRIGEQRCEASPRRLERLLPQVRRNLQRAQEALGYYRSDNQLAFSQEESCWRLRIDVSPGERVRFERIDITVEGDEADRALFAEIVDNPPIAAGDPLNHSRYEQLKSSLSSTAVENGYFGARFNRSQLRVDPQQNTARVNLVFAPGARYRFGEVHINELDALSREFISRFLPFSPGTAYSSEALINLRENLNDSQYFSEVSATPELDQASNNRVPVSVELTPRDRRSYTAGIGVSTDVGPRLRLAYEDRYITRSGHRFEGDLTVSPAQQEPSLSYFIPLRDPVNESLRLSSGFMRRQTDSFTSRAYQVGLNYRSMAGRWTQNLFTNFQHETSILDVTRQQTNSTISGISWSRTRSDDPIYPTRGWRLYGEITGSHEAVLSDVSFTQFYGSGKFIESVGPGRFLLRGELAATLVDDVVDLPVSARYFTGGDQSVRGYEWSSIGATNAQGETTGGKNLAVASIEYDFPIRENWNLAAFVDAGDTVNDFGNLTLKKSLGAGVRWLSPIGAIRLDIAHGLNEGGDWRVHLTMGPDL